MISLIIRQQKNEPESAIVSNRSVNLGNEYNQQHIWYLWVEQTVFARSIPTDHHFCRINHGTDEHLGHVFFDKAIWGIELLDTLFLNLVGPIQQVHMIGFIYIYICSENSQFLVETN